jgi:hypothetical protein
MSKKIKIFVFGLFLLVSSMTFTPSANAIFSWPDIGNAFIRTMLDNMWIQIRAALVGALKKAAIETMSETVNNLVSGTSQASSLFISDWSDYLFTTPKNNSRQYMNDFFTITTRGKSSGSYSSSRTCGSDNYSNWRTQRAKGVNVEIDLTDLQDNFEEFACSPVEMFADGSWAAYNAFMSPNNNPLIYAMITEEIAAKKELEEKEKARTQAQAYGGFIGQSKNGLVVTPGSLIKDITAAANTMDNDAIANARNVGEVTGIVVGKIASNVIKQGIGNARQQIQNKINDGICEGSQSLRDQLKELTPDGNLMSGFGMGSLGNTKGSSTCRLN